MGATSVFPKTQMPDDVFRTGQHLPALDGIRGIAILMVFAVHYGDYANSRYPVLRILNVLRSFGWTGVHLFFVLSGFLITGILWDTRNQPNRWKNFYMRRVLRIFPVFYGVWALLLLYIFLAHLPWHNFYLAYLCYLGNMTRADDTVGVLQIGHMWTLAVEEQFYLIWPLVLWRFRKPKQAIRALGAAAVLSFVFKLILTLARTSDDDPMYQWLPSNVEGLALGSILALACRIPEARSFLSSVKRFLPLVLLMILGVVIGFHSHLDSSTWARTISIPLVSVAAALMILNSLDGSSICSRIGCAPILRFYGKYSYGFYLYHGIVIDWMQSPVFALLSVWISSRAVAAVLCFIICFAALTLLSVASYHCFESLFLRMKKSYEISAPNAGELRSAEGVCP